MTIRQLARLDPFRQYSTLQDRWSAKTSSAI